MCVGVHLCECVCVFVFEHVRACVYLNGYMPMYACLWVCMCDYTHVCLYPWVCVAMCAWMYMCECVCVWVNLSACVCSYELSEQTITCVNQFSPFTNRFQRLNFSGLVALPRLLSHLRLILSNCAHWLRTTIIHGVSSNPRLLQLISAPFLNSQLFHTF